MDPVLGGSKFLRGVKFQITEHILSIRTDRPECRPRSGSGPFATHPASLDTFISNKMELLKFLMIKVK